jgi:N-acetylmuramic acid 6-phosphate (MurNAc-6-P) etherase
MEGESSRDQIREFLKITNCTAEQAMFFLEASRGQFDNAISMFMGKFSDKKSPALFRMSLKEHNSISRSKNRHQSHE